MSCAWARIMKRYCDWPSNEWSSLRAMHKSESNPEVTEPRGQKAQKPMIEPNLTGEKKNLSVIMPNDILLYS